MAAQENTNPEAPGDLVSIMMAVLEYDGVNFPGLVLRESLEELKTFDVRPDDIWVCTYPKSGTHFAMEIVSLIIGDGDPFKVNRLSHLSTVAMMRVDRPFSVEDQPQGQPPQGVTQGQGQSQLTPGKPPPFIDVIKNAPSPRVICTHVPFKCLPPNIEKRAKVLYVARNPKDQLTSTYNFVVKTLSIPGGFPKLVDDMMSDEGQYGGWLPHVMGYWNKRHEKNVLFLKYEDMKQDLRGCVLKVTELLEHPLTDAIFDQVVEKSDFAGMKKTYDHIEKSSKDGIMFTRAGGQMPFMQKGKIGSWKDRITVAQNEALDAWYKEKFAGLDLQFQFE